MSLCALAGQKSNYLGLFVCFSSKPELPELWMNQGIIILCISDLVISYTAVGVHDKAVLSFNKLTHKWIQSSEWHDCVSERMHIVKYSHV